MPDPPKPPPPPAPPPEKPPEALEDAVDSNSSALKKKRKGAKAKLGRGATGVQTAGAGTSGLGISS
tara:strand:- start:1831 stop:2028 length:198 start_codon:yes stop_codon:yes gene_type:complete